MKDTKNKIEKKIIDILYTWLHNRDSYTKELPPMPISALIALVEKAVEEERKELLGKVKKLIKKEYRINWDMEKTSDDIEVFMENIFERFNSLTSNQRKGKE